MSKDHISFLFAVFAVEDNDRAQPGGAEDEPEPVVVRMAGPVPRHGGVGAAPQQDRRLLPRGEHLLPLDAEGQGAAGCTHGGKNFLSLGRAGQFLGYCCTH